MLSLNITIERNSLQDRLFEQAIAAHKLNAEQFSSIVEVLNREQISLQDFWAYVTDREISEGVAKSSISSAVKQVLSVEQFNNLIKHDITWVN